MKDARSCLIVALDVPDRAAACGAVARLSGHVGCFKLGLEIFIREGPRLVEEIRDRGERVFLDLKLHDIPNTVAGAVRSACALGVEMLTLHAAGGAEMLEAAGKAARSHSNPPMLLAVTALTSLSQQAAQGIGISTPVSDWVDKLADLACGAGIPGLVVSARELPPLRRKYGSTVSFVVPGIRPKGTAAQDQQRIAEPGEAIRAGADYLVVGRPVLLAPDPARAADLIVGEIADALRWPTSGQNP